MSLNIDEERLDDPPDTDGKVADPREPPHEKGRSQRPRA